MSLTQTEIAGVLGFAVLVGLCTASLFASWETRRLMLAVFGDNPGPAQLGARGYYVRPPGLPLEPGPSPTPAAPRTPPAPATPPGSARPGALAPAVQPPPGSSGARALPPADKPMPGSSRPPYRYMVEAPLAAGTHGPPTLAPTAAQSAREPFKLPSLAPLPDYAAQVRGPAPDAESSPGDERAPGAPAAPSPRRAVHPPPIPREEPELPKGDAPPDTWRKPGSEPSSRERPAVTAPVDRAKLARDLDESDQAQSQQAPELRRVPTTRPPPSSQAPAASGAQVAVAPPASGPAQRPSTGRQTRSERPPPHAPPQPIQSTRRSLLGGLAGAQPERHPSDPARTARECKPPQRAPIGAPVSAPPAALAPAGPLPAPTPPPPRAAQPSQLGGGLAAHIARATGENADGEETHMQIGTLPKANAGDFDSVDEVTRVAPRPTAAALAVGAPVAPGAQGTPRARSRYATLASMPSVVPPSARPQPDVEIIDAAATGDDAKRAPAPVGQ